MWLKTSSLRIVRAYRRRTSHPEAKRSNRSSRVQENNFGWLGEAETQSTSNQNATNDERSHGDTEETKAKFAPRPSAAAANVRRLVIFARGDFDFYLAVAGTGIAARLGAVDARRPIAIPAAMSAITALP